MRNLSDLFSLTTFFVFYWTIFSLTFVENGISWGKYNTDITQYSYLFGVYCIAIITGSSIGKLTFNYIRPSTIDIDINIKKYYLIIIIALTFCAIKIIALGTIPAFSSDPTIRSTGNNLGGYIDYPARLITLVSIISFTIYTYSGSKMHAAMAAIGVSINILLVNRSELLLIIFACAAIWSHQRYASKPRLIFFLIALPTLILLVISSLAIVRYGHDNLGASLGIAELAAWVIHGDLTGALSFGSYISDKLNDSYMYGRYCFGEYLSIFIPNFNAHGAEYLRDEYLPDKKTAQSVGSPFNYYIDFGWLGVTIFGIILGIVYNRLRNSYAGGQSVIGVFMFPIFFYQLMLSARNGIFPLNPIFLYFLAATIFITPKNNGTKLRRYTLASIDLIFLLTVLVSITAAAIRI
jgi:oligosaccharide repeat unit polymerase